MFGSSMVFKENYKRLMIYLASDVWYTWNNSAIVSWFFFKLMSKRSEHRYMSELHAFICP